MNLLAWDIPLPVIGIDILLLLVVGVYTFMGFKNGFKSTFFGFGTIIITLVVLKWLLPTASTTVDDLDYKIVDWFSKLFPESMRVVENNAIATILATGYIQYTASLIIGLLVSAIVLYPIYMFGLKGKINEVNKMVPNGVKNTIGIVSGLFTGIFSMLIISTLFFTPSFETEKYKKFHNDSFMMSVFNKMHVNMLGDFFDGSILGKTTTLNDYEFTISSNNLFENIC